MITWTMLLLSPPRPPVFLLPNRTIGCYWGSESGPLEKVSRFQILSRNREGDDAERSSETKRDMKGTCSGVSESRSPPT